MQQLLCHVDEGSQHAGILPGNGAHVHSGKINWLHAHRHAPHEAQDEEWQRGSAPPGGLLLSLQSSCWQWRQALRLSRVLVDTPAPNDPSIDIHQTVMYWSCHQKLPFSLCHNSNTREHGGGEGTTTQRAMAGSGVHCQKSNTSSFLQGKIFPFLLQDIDKRLM